MSLNQASPIAEVLRRLKGKKLLLLGYGREGQASLALIRETLPDADLTVADRKEQTLPDGVAGIFGADYQKTLREYDVIIKSPGIVLEDKSPALLEKVTSQTELFLAAYRGQVIGITGTKGKSTTTSLIHHVLQSVYPDTLLMGNIGIPAFSLADKVGEKTILVYELSCHQLEYTRVSPHIAVLLNLFEEHLDHYGTKEAYFDAKRNIARFQDEHDLYFCNYLQRNDLPDARAQRFTMEQAEHSAADLQIVGREVRFAGHTLPLPEGCTLLEGTHNLYNIGVAYGVCLQYGITDEQFLAALATFSPLPHRLQKVGTFDGVTYYDDSISTAVETAVGALKALAQYGVGSILLGGMDRGIDYEGLCDYLLTCPQDNPRYLILMPDSGLRIGRMLREKGFPADRLVETDGLESAVRAAKRLTPKGSVCLLSPASASYGFFKNFEERGEYFQRFVKE